MTELKANSAWGIHILEIQNKKKIRSKTRKGYKIHPWTRTQSHGYLQFDGPFGFGFFLHIQGKDENAPRKGPTWETDSHSSTWELLFFWGEGEQNTIRDRSRCQYIYIA